MALPKMNIIKHTLTLPSNGKELTYRPFLVKEEKILMMAQEAGDTNSMMNGVKQIIQNQRVRNKDSLANPEVLDYYENLIHVLIVNKELS